MSKQLEFQNKLAKIDREIANAEGLALNDLQAKYRALAISRIAEYNSSHVDSYMYENAHGNFVIVRDETKLNSNK